MDWKEFTDLTMDSLVLGVSCSGRRVDKMISVYGIMKFPELSWVADTLWCYTGLFLFEYEVPYNEYRGGVLG